MCAKVLNSDNEDIKQRVLSGETSISAGYKELQNEKQKVDEVPKLQNVKKQKVDLLKKTALQLECNENPGTSGK